MTRTDSESLRRQILLRTTMGVQTFHGPRLALVIHGFGAGLFPRPGAVPASGWCVVVVLIFFVLVLTEYFFPASLFTGFTSLSLLLL